MGLLSGPSAFSELGQGIAGIGKLGSGVGYELSGGRIGSDITPNGSLMNAGRTQLANLTGTKVAGLNTSVAPNDPAQLQVLHDQGNQVRASNQQATHNSGAYDPTAAQAAQDRNNALYGIDSGLSSANDALGRLDSQAQVGNGNIDNEYQAAYDQLLGSNQVAQRNYDTSRTGQVNDYVAKQADNATNARTWLDSARRTLGAQGAGDSSASRYALPYDAQQQLAQGNSQAQATNNKNLIALDTNWADTEDKFKNAQADVANQRDQGKRDLQSNIANQRATLLSTIAQLTGQKNIANGGDYKSAAAAAQGYTSQIPALLDRINALSATPHIAAQQVTTTAPTLDQYNYARPVAQTAPVQDASLSNPILAAILGANQQDQSQLQPAFA